MKLQDTIYNWLTIKVVVDAVPEDEAAKETLEVFDNILKEDHALEQLHVEVKDHMYVVTYEKDGKEQTQRFPEELITVLLNTIQNPPKAT